MKNIFKSLMLVAVAAMGFTACEKENNENNNGTEQKAVITGVATIDNDNTRSGFNGTTTNEESKTLYTSTWDGGEQITVTDANDGLNSVTTTIDAEGNFTAVLSGNVNTVIVRSPAKQWSIVGTHIIPLMQTPRANSVDPAAHILKGEAAVTNGTATVAMKHAVAYGKMTVDTPAEFDIDYVELTLNTDTSYTIYADKVEDNTFWFATEAMNVNSFTVSAYGAEGEVYAKTVSDLPAEGEGSLKFQNGRVSTFVVSDLEKQEGEHQSYPIFTNGVWSNNDPSDKLITLTGDGSLTLALNFSRCNSSNWIDKGKYTISWEGAGPWKIYGTWGTWGQYIDAAGNQYGFNGGTVTVSVVEGKYDFVIENLMLCNMMQTNQGVLPYARFTGEITNLGLPQ